MAIAPSKTSSSLTRCMTQSSVSMLANRILRDGFFVVKITDVDGVRYNQGGRGPASRDPGLGS